MNDYTYDTFFNGSLRVKQERAGYRFSIDAVILANLVRPRDGDQVLELGAGCGIVLLMLAYRYPRVRYFGVEIQPDLHRLAQANIRDNGMQDIVRIYSHDLRDLKTTLIGEPVDLVISNPPYRKIDSGRINPNRQKAVARHELELTLPEMLLTVRRMLRTAGKFVAIYTAERTSDMLSEMKTVGIEPKFIRMVYSGWQTEAKRILVEGVKGARSGCKIGAPLVIYNDDGSYTDEITRMFQG